MRELRCGHLTVAAGKAGPAAVPIASRSPLPVPRLETRSLGDEVAELAHLIEEAPPPLRRPRRDPDPPNPRVWAYRKVPVPFRHLATRFLRSLSRRPPSPGTLAWARGLLTDREWELFRAQAGFDMRHAAGVARAVLALTANPLAARAALLHDIGKVDSRLGALGRACATFLRRLVPHLSDRWSRRIWAEVTAIPDARVQPRGLRERFAVYWMHPWIGRAVLLRHGVDADVASWALFHHHWYVAEDLPFTWKEALALWYADGD
ncbi:MAG: hypothetical protein DYH08_13295 [Actinobacteria bacterium ATB1]|nr:hypothetical protein [Actinobacteria bacterium ATB1]